MQHHYDLRSIMLDQPSMVTIGVFDGMHRGHQELIRSLVADARTANALSVVVTFFPHPDAVLRGITGRYYLTTPEERAQLMGELGVDHVITLPFNEEFRQIRAATFVNMLVEQLKMTELAVGADFALGYKREGNVEFLRARGQEQGFKMRVFDLVRDGGTEKISSMSIREALSTGNVEQARDWLGRSYSVTGEVVGGDKRGRTIGFPTANIAVWEALVIPANGIYAGWVILDGKPYMAATNVGTRPTFDGEGVTVEAFILDFDRSIYGEKITFTFEKRLRPEEKYDSIEALIAQIDLDVQHTRAYLESVSPPVP